MKKPCIRCPSGYARKRVTDGDWVVVCRIIADKISKKQETYPHFEIVPENCKDDVFIDCQVWRDEVDVGWKTRVEKKGLKNFEKVIASW